MDRRNSVEIQAISVDEAVRLALEQLGRKREEVEIEVLAEPSGMAGAEEEEALVRVTVRGQASQPMRGAGGAPVRSAGVATDEVLPPADADTEVAIEVTTELLQAMGFQARVVPDAPLADDGEDGPPTLGVNVIGNDLGMLIGRRAITWRSCNTWSICWSTVAWGAGCG